MNNENNINKDVAKKESTVASKRAKFRAASVFIAVLIIAMVIVANLLIGAIGTKLDMNVDLTMGKILDFSDETKNVLKELDKDINIYSLIPEELLLNEGTHASISEANDMINEVLEKYDQLSDKVKYKRIDTTKNPEFLKKFDDETIDQYSVIFECEDRFRTVNINDIVGVNYSDVMQTIMTQTLNAEQKFTNAIIHVINSNPVKVGLVQGHGEIIAEDFETSVLAPENYSAVEINLLDNNIPEDVDMLIIAAPQKDFAAEEIKTLDAYFDNGGNVQLILECTNGSLPNLENYLSEWGVTAYNGYVVEQDSNKVYSNSPVLIYPEIHESQMTDGIIDGKYRILYPNARGMTIHTVAEVEYAPLLTSSENSYIKIDGSSVEKSDGDIEGPAIIAASITRYSQNGNPKFIILGGMGVFSGAPYSEANNDFYYNSLSFLAGNESSIYIRPKNISPNVLLITKSQGYLIAGITVIIIPVLILIAGFIVWVRRRHL